MSSFWESHKHKILGAVFGIVATLVMVGANLLCGKAGALEGICVTSAKVVADQIKLESAKESGIEYVKPSAVVDDTAVVCDENHCLSNGYALPLEDGGHCRCFVKP